MLLIGYSASINTVTAVSFVGQSMTLAETAGRSQVWYLLNPATSAGTFVITANDSTSKYAMSALSLSGNAPAPTPRATT